MRNSTLVFFFIILFSSQNLGQNIDWVFLPDGDSNGICASNSDYLTDNVCFGIQYVPGVTGTVTSYTMGFVVDCVGTDSPYEMAQSCVMDDQTTVFNGCDILGQILLLTSGNNGSLSVVAGDTVILHQVCLSLAPGDSLLVSEDMTTGITISIDSINGGGPITDSPDFVDFTADDSGFGIVPCADTTICSVVFGSKDGRIDFTFNGNGNISDGASLLNSLPVAHSFDVYDEENELCQLQGGLDDITLTFEILNTVDVNNNGLIDTLGGVEHFITQGVDGLEAEIPLGTSMDSETSSGDIRGYSIRVDFADHLEILAHQLTVDASGLNSAGVAFESARILFYDENDSPFGIGTYNGFYTSGADLTGLCIPSGISADPYTVLGNGVVVFDDTNTVNLTDPCNPIDGTATIDVVNINARFDAGLDSSAVIGGFSLIVQAEDVASPNMLDDGSNTNGEDDIAANKPTSTSELLLSSILGYTIDGCVFPSQVLDVNYTSFDAFEKDGKVQLEWSTSEEINHSHFEIQWSDERVNMNTIGSVNEKVIVDDQNAYYFLHDFPSKGFNYYRLAQYDLDGSLEYSEIKSVYIKDEVLNDIHIYPNPSFDLVTINFQNNNSDELSLEIYSTQGTLVNSSTIDSSTGQMILDISQYENGVYFVKLGGVVKRLIKY